MSGLCSVLDIYLGSLSGTLREAITARQHDRYARGWLLGWALRAHPPDPSTLAKAPARRGPRRAAHAVHFSSHPRLPACVSTTTAQGQREGQLQVCGAPPWAAFWQKCRTSDILRATAAVARLLRDPFQVGPTLMDVGRPTSDRRTNRSSKGRVASARNVGRPTVVPRTVTPDRLRVYSIKSYT
jgi:hypothetical protein